VDERNLQADAHMSTLSPVDALNAARAGVAKLGATPWTKAAAASSEALSALSDVVAAVDCSHSLRETVRKMRWNAGYLGSDDSSVFARTQYVKEGLREALGALDGSSSSEELSMWAESARKAVERIDTSSASAFQRATIQDAFRTTVDAFSVAYAGAGECSRSDAHSLTARSESSQAP
jgi:hypothetical protein